MKHENLRGDKARPNTFRDCIPLIGALLWAILYAVNGIMELHVNTGWLILAVVITISALYAFDSNRWRF